MLLAKACSAPATVHFMHSKNWTQETKGASHLDMLVERDEASRMARLGVVRAGKKVQMIDQVGGPGCKTLA
jgi:hypothetical protein